MTETLRDIAENVKLWKARRQVERAVLQGSGEQCWALRCLHLGCNWGPGQTFQTADAAKMVAEFHADRTGHSIKLRAVIETDAGVVRPKAGGL